MFMLVCLFVFSLLDGTQNHVACTFPLSSNERRSSCAAPQSEKTCRSGSRTDATCTPPRSSSPSSSSSPCPGSLSTPSTPSYTSAQRATFTSRSYSYPSGSRTSTLPSIRSSMLWACGRCAQPSSCCWPDPVRRKPAKRLGHSNSVSRTVCLA